MARRHILNRKHGPARITVKTKEIIANGKRGVSAKPKRYKQHAEKNSASGKNKNACAKTC